LVAPCLLK